MKKAVIRSRSGAVLDFFESDDPSIWLVDGMRTNKWGAAGEYIVEILDKEILHNKDEKNKDKRLSLARDWEALANHRRMKLEKRIFQWILTNAEINVEDI
jgi:hypothetical protein